MASITEWIGRHQVVAFFVITFAITWGLGFSYNAVLNENQFWFGPLAFVATCGPALAGILISTVTNTKQKSGQGRARWIAFALAWGVVAVVFAAHNTLINGAPVSPALLGFTLISVVPVAFIISATYSRVPPVRRYMASLIRLRGVVGWCVLALVLIPGLVLLSLLINRLLGRQPAASPHTLATGLPLLGLIAVKFLYQFFFVNATGEEAGWRGFALPRLQASTSPLIAGLILAVFWAPWHLFLWYAEGQAVFAWQYWLGQYISLVPASILIGWLYNRSRASILVAGIAHASGNTVFAFVPGLDWLVFSLTMFAAVAVLVVADRMWQRLPAGHPAVHGVDARAVRGEAATAVLAHQSR